MGNALLLSSMRYEVYTATAGGRACPCVCVHAYKKIHVSGNKARDQYPSVPFLCQKKWTHILSGEDKDDGARYFFGGNVTMRSISMRISTRLAREESAEC